MSLLVDMTTNTLDESYAEAARRRAVTERSGSRGTGWRPGRGGRLGVVLALIAVGAVTGTAAAQVRQRDAQSADLQPGLAAEAARRTAESNALNAEAQSLRQRVDQDRDAALGSGASGRAEAARLAELELAAAAVAVEGPGVVVVLDDVPPEPEQEQDEADTRGGGRLERGRVYDTDLQQVVNGLWAAGAEAIAVNGQRLTSLTAIRSAGEAVLVDYRPLVPPYTVEAIGDSSRLEPDFADGPAGRNFTTLRGLGDLRYELRSADRLRLPAASPPELRSLDPAAGGTS